MIKKRHYYGTAKIDSFSPPIVEATTTMLNCRLDFGELLKFKAAVDEAVRRFNRYNQKDDNFDTARVDVTVDIKGKRFTVHPPDSDTAYRTGVRA